MIQQPRPSQKYAKWDKGTRMKEFAEYLEVSSDELEFLLEKLIEESPDGPKDSIRTILMQLKLRYSNELADYKKTTNTAIRHKSEVEYDRLSNQLIRDMQGDVHGPQDVSREVRDLFESFVELGFIKKAWFGGYNMRTDKIPNTVWEDENVKALFYRPPPPRGRTPGMRKKL